MSSHSKVNETRFADRRASLLFHNLVSWANEHNLQMLVVSNPTINKKLGQLIKYPHLTSYGQPIVTIDRSEYNEGPEFSCDIAIPVKHFKEYTVPPEPNENGDVVIKFHFLMLVGTEYHYDASEDAYYHHIAIFSEKVVYNTVLTDYALKKDAPPANDHGRTLITWSKTHTPNGYTMGHSTKKCEKVSVKDRYGLDMFMDNITTDLATLKEKVDIMNRLGISSCINYLISGPAGVGKTSLVKIVADVFNMPIFVANMSSHDPKTNYDNLLSPNPRSYLTNWRDDMFAIVLIEDFAYSPENASEILNALDGVHSGQNIIRFFSTNSPESLATIDSALKTRFHRHFSFPSPDIKSISEHLIQVFPEQMGLATLLAKDFVSITNISFRTINRYIARHVASPSILSAALEGMDEFKKEMESYNDSKTVVVTSSSGSQ